jgi:hypothetical protein
MAIKKVVINDVVRMGLHQERALAKTLKKLGKGKEKTLADNAQPHDGISN